jgi:hypothetical protein
MSMKAMLVGTSPQVYDFAASAGPINSDSPVMLSTLVGRS